MGEAKVGYYRAAQMQAKLKVLQSMDPEIALQTLRALPKETLQTIRESRKTQWLDIRHDMILNEVHGELHGEEELRRFCKESIMISLNSPTLSPLLVGTVALFGQSLAHFMQMVPRGWGLVFRDCGGVSCERQKSGAKLFWRDFPEVVATPNYMIGVAGGFDAIIKIGGKNGRCDVESLSVEHRSVIFHCHWEPPFGD